MQTLQTNQHAVLVQSVLALLESTDVLPGAVERVELDHVVDPSSNASVETLLGVEVTVQTCETRVAGGHDDDLCLAGTVQEDPVQRVAVLANSRPHGDDLLHG